MKKPLLIIAVLFSFQSFSQNLVNNPSFETYNPCPTFVSQIDYATGWITSVNTPDYYNACNNTSMTNPGMVGVPTSVRGYQPARTGVAFSGVVIYYTSQPDYREIFYAQLSAPLSAGVVYNVGMYVVMNEDNAMWAVDGGLGIYLSSSPINPLTPFAYTPQIMNPLTNVLNDSLNWTMISGTYTAVGGENYITIGSFIPDNQLTIINRGGTYSFTSYGIDDVWVIADSIFTSSQNTNYSNDFSANVYPNPSTGEVNLTISMTGMNDVNCEIFNALGERVMMFEKKSSSSFGEKIDLGNLPNGIYYFRISTGEKAVYKKIMIVR